MLVTMVTAGALAELPITEGQSPLRLDLGVKGR